MQIEFTGRQTEIPARLRALADRRLQKLARSLRGITRAHVVLIAEKHRQVAEVTVQCRRRLALSAREVGSDPARSLGTALDRIARQAQRQIGKRQERKREAPRPALAPRRA